MALQQYDFTVSFETGNPASETIQAESCAEAWAAIVARSHAKDKARVTGITLGQSQAPIKKMPMPMARGRKSYVRAEAPRGKK